MYENTLSVTVLLIALGQILLTISLAIPRLNKAPIYLPLTLFFISSGLTFSLPAINTIWPKFTYYSLYLLLPTIFIQPVSLWLYIKGLTTTKAWRINRHYWPHFIPALLGVLSAVYIATIPSSMVIDLVITGQQPTEKNAIVLVLMLFILFVIFMIQTTTYLIVIVKRLIRYRQQLHAVFSSTEQKELLWVTWLVSIFALTWIAVLLHMFPFIYNNSPLVSSDFISLCYFAMIWTLSIWGLRQKPGFESHNVEAGKPVNNIDILSTISTVPERLPNEKPRISSPQSKYHRSALGKDQSKSIANKLHKAMQSQQYYLHANLSLPELAKYLLVPPNYLSQTLNEHLGESFFDYVNRLRTEHAKTLITKQDTSLLDIAMASGFNAKSSFYKAFKKYTGVTPGKFKKNLSNNVKIEPS